MPNTGQFSQEPPIFFANIVRHYRKLRIADFAAGSGHVLIIVAQNRGIQKK